MGFAPGNLVTARGREWVVLPESTDDFLVLRPIAPTATGAEKPEPTRLRDEPRPGSRCATPQVSAPVSVPSPARPRGRPA